VGLKDSNFIDIVGSGYMPLFGVKQVGIIGSRSLDMLIVMFWSKFGKTYISYLQ